MLPIYTILHPTDFSEYSEYAFRFACSLARDHRARIVVLHVAAPPPVVYGDVIAQLPMEVSRESLEVQLRQIEGPADVPVVRRLHVGHPVHEILSVAKETNAGLIVMGTHGRTGLGRMLLGSVAEQVLRNAKCPVLTVKGPVPGTSGPEAEDDQYAAGVVEGKKVEVGGEG
jgi:nucleotide-binding universal stress UspA family protein